MKLSLISGYVGRDAELRTDQVGNEFITFSVGVSVGTKDKPKTDWIDVSCSGKQLESAKLVKKRCKVFVEGFPTVGTYINKENKVVAVEKIFAHRIDILIFKDEPVQNEPTESGSDDKAKLLTEPVESKTV